MRPKLFTPLSLGSDTELQKHLSRLADDAEGDKRGYYCEEPDEPVMGEEQAAAVVANLLHAAEQGRMESDAVVLPNHYRDFAIEPIRFICENELDFFQGNILKYLLRYPKKNGLEDLKKGYRYFGMYIKFIERDPDWWKAPST